MTSGKRVIAFIATLVMLVSLVGIPVQGTPSEVQAATGKEISGTYLYSQTSSILRRVNRQRTNAGSDAVVLDEDLMKLASLRAAEIYYEGSHSRPDGTYFYTIVGENNVKVNENNIAENIAYGHHALETAGEAMDEWMDSTAHRETILDPGYNCMGVACFQVRGEYFWVQLFANKDIKDTTVGDDMDATIHVASETDDTTYIMNIMGSDIGVQYSTHVQTYGWMPYNNNGYSSGTFGESKRLEAIRISLMGADGKDIGVRYRTHVQRDGWHDWSYDGDLSGTSGESKRLEAICIELTGSDSSKYDIYYRVHVQTYGWLGWAKNGEPAGTAGQSKRLEAIQIKVVPKNAGVQGLETYSFVDYGLTPTITAGTGMVQYRTHVQTYGWENFVEDGSISGSFGQSKRLEGICIELETNNLGVSGGIRYTTHVQTYGWQDWSYDGAMSGTSGESKRLEAIKIELTGDAAVFYDVYYRVHAQTFGWLGWAKNGECAGTAGMSKRLEAIQIVIVPKDFGAPSTSSQPAYYVQ